MIQQNSAFSRSFYTVFLKWIFFLLAALYLINCFTPLRLHVDMIRYFAIKDCIEYGCPPDSEAAKDYLPYGYTALLLFLSKLGWLKSSVIVFINCLYLTGALVMVKKIFESYSQPLFFIVLVLLNWTIIKFAAHPLSELQYMFFSMTSLYFFYQYTKNKKLAFLFYAFMFGGFAFLTRTVGVALAAALVTGLIWQYRKELVVLLNKNRILVAIIIVVLIGVVAFSKQLGLNHYTGVMTKQFDDGLTFGQILQWHFTEWTEIFFNVSIVKVVPYLPSSVSGALVLIAGIALLFFFLYIVFIRKNSIPFIVKAYLFYYIILMFNWPFYDPRFWVPLIPIMAAVVSGIKISSSKAIRFPIVIFTTVYFLLGIASVGYMTYTSLNKGVLATRQANGVYRNEYETLFFGKPQTDTAKHIDPLILSILKRYDH